MRVERVGLVASLIVNAGLLINVAYAKLVEDPQKATKQDIARVDSALSSASKELEALDGRVIMLDTQIDKELEALDARLRLTDLQVDSLKNGATDGRLVRQIYCDNLNQQFLLFTGTLMDDDQCRKILENIHRSQLEDLREMQSDMQDPVEVI